MHTRNPVKEQSALRSRFRNTSLRSKRFASINTGIRWGLSFDRAWIGASEKNWVRGFPFFPPPPPPRPQFFFCARPNSRAVTNHNSSNTRIYRHDRLRRYKCIKCQMSTVRSHKRKPKKNLVNAALEQYTISAFVFFRNKPETFTSMAGMVK